MTEEAKKGGPQLVYSAPPDDATASFVPPWVPMPGDASPSVALPPRVDFRKTPQRRTDIVKGLVPDAEITLLGGHGGAGKGFFTLQASCAVSLGVPFMECQTVKGRVLYWSAEDPEYRVTLRLHDICRLHGYDLGEVYQNLHIFDATEFDGFYGEVLRRDSEGSPYRALGEMPGYEAYLALVKQIDPVLCIVDGTGDTYEGNDLVRQQVKAFIRLLLRVNKNRRVATVLTTHTDRSHSRGNRFQLIAAMNPCRCGRAGEPGFTCKRGPRCADEYQARLSGPFLDRIDLHLEVPSVSASDLVLPAPAEGSREVAARVAMAREIQLERYAALGRPDVRTNAEASGPLLDAVATPDSSGAILLRDAADAMRLSARGYHRVLKVARTLADLDGADGVGRRHLAEALAYRAAAERPKAAA
jgi:hypothetical protein